MFRNQRTIVRHKKLLPSFYPVKRVEKGRTMKLCVSTYSEMVAVDAIVVYIQSTPNFPSWTSRVRSPSPALSKQELTDSGKLGVLQNTPLSISERLLKLVHRFLPQSEIRDCVHVLIHIERVPQLISDE